MLGLFLIYYIGKTFYALAELYSKSKWTFAILGIASYYAGAFLVGMLIGLYNLFFESTFGDDFSDFQFGLLALPFGVLACVILYQSIKHFWSKSKESRQNLETLDDGIL